MVQIDEEGRAKKDGGEERLLQRILSDKGAQAAPNATWRHTGADMQKASYQSRAQG
jgi:hypothetical protein